MNMIKNKKGFTMIEMLAVVIILALLLAIAVPAVSKQLGGFRVDYYDSLETSVLTSGEDYFLDKKFSRPSELLNSNVVTVEELVNSGYLDEEVIDYGGSSCDANNSYVVIVKVGVNKYEYATCLECSGDGYSTINSDKYKEEIKKRKDSGEYIKDYCNVVWKTSAGVSSEYDIENTEEDESVFVSGEFPADKKVQVKYDVSKNTIEKYIGMRYSAEKKNGNDVLLKVYDGEAIYPDNMNELVQKNAEKEIILKYEVPNKTEKVEVQAWVKERPSSQINVGIYYAVATPTHAVNTSYVLGDVASSLRFDLSTKFRGELKEYQYQLNGTGQWKTACEVDSNNKCSFVYNTDFKGTIKFRGVDKDGNNPKGILETSEYNINLDNKAPVCTIMIKDKDGNYVETDDNKNNDVAKLIVETNSQTEKFTFNILCLDENLDASQTHIEVKANNGSGEVKSVNNGGNLDLAVNDTYLAVPIGVDKAGNYSDSESGIITINEKEVVGEVTTSCDRNGNSICYYNINGPTAEAFINAVGDNNFDVSISYFGPWNCYTGNNSGFKWHGYGFGSILGREENDLFGAFRCWEGSKCYDYLSDIGIGKTLPMQGATAVVEGKVCACGDMSCAM